MSNKKIAKNTFFLAVRTLVSLFVSFYTTRVILHALGAIDYGLFNVIYGVVAFFTFIVSSFNDSVQRYIAVALGRKEIKYIQDTVFNSFILYLISAVIFCTILFLVRNLVVENVLHLPIKSLKVAQYLYIISILSIFITIIQTPLNALVLAHEKMSFYAYMSIFDAVSKLLVSYLLVLIPGEKIIVYAGLLFSTSLLVFLIYLNFCYRRFRYVFFKGNVSSEILKNISIFSFWNVFGNFAYVCRTQGINLLINIFFGVVVNAAYGISVSIINATNSFVQAFSSAIRPQIFKSYGENNIVRFHYLVSMGSKYTFSILFIICCPVIISANHILDLWLTNPPKYSNLFVRGFLISALIDSFSICLISGIQSTGKIKFYQITVGFVVFLSFPITFVFFKMGFAPSSICYSVCFVSLIALPLRLFFISKLTQFDILVYMKTVIFPCLAFSILTFIIDYNIRVLFNFNIFYELIIFFLISGLVSLCIFILVVLTSMERKSIFMLLMRRLK